MRTQHKSLFFVNSICGQTVDVCLSETLARDYVKKSRVPHQFRVYEQTQSGMMFECPK